MKKFLTALATAGLLVGVLSIPAAKPAKAAPFPAMYVNKSSSVNMASERSCKNSEWHDIQDAINNADDDTTIIICPGVWRLSSTLHTDATTGLTLQGFGSKTVLDGTDSGQIVDALTGATELNSFSLRTLTVQNAHSYGFGGAIVTGDFTCDRVNFKNNVAYDTMGPGVGGAVFALGDATFNACTFTGNKAESFGGAAWIWGTLTDRASTYKLNTAGSGGALYLDDDDNVGASITGSTFTGNRAIYNYEVGGDGGFQAGEGDGGAVLYNGAATLTVTGSTFTKNFAGNDGGAIDASDVGDEAFGGDGFCDSDIFEIFCDSPNGDIVVTSSKFVGNEADSQGPDADTNDGGAIANEGGDVYAYGSIFQANQAGSDGGAISGEWVEISGNRFIGNHAYLGVGGAAYAGWDFYGDPSANTYRGNRDRDGVNTWAWD